MIVSGGLIHFPLASAAAATPRFVLPKINHLSPTHTHIKQHHQRRLRLAVIRSTTNSNNNGQTSTSAIEPAAATPKEEELAKGKQGGEGNGGGGGDGDDDDGARKEKEGWWLLNGVAEEVRQIQWPQFAKVLGTTGVVLYVIAGSSAVLLTVNALLAELSDRIFAGKGLQDFFSG
ncbi:hypothetical protein Drorol1_Dr00019030 [Drosera rotundifolia]